MSLQDELTQQRERDAAAVPVRRDGDDAPPAVRPNALATVDLKAVALSRFGEWRAGAAALVEKYKGVVFDCMTTKGMAEAVAARMEVRAPRYAAQNVSKASKSELAAVSKAVGAEEEAIIKFLADTEAAIDSQIRVAEERKAMEKAERERQEAEAAAAEVARIKRHREAIETIHQYPIHAAGLPSERIEKGVKALQEMTFGEAQEECLPDYQAARDAALSKMLTMLDEAWQREAMEVKLKAQLAEIALREKQLAERERYLAEREAAQLAAARKAKAEHEAREAAEAARLEAAFAAAAAEATRIDNLAKQIGEELAENREMTSPPKPVWVGVDLGAAVACDHKYTTSVSEPDGTLFRCVECGAAVAPGGPVAADQAPANTQAPAETPAAPAAFQPDIPGIPVPPTDEEAAEKEPHLITLGEVCRRIEHKVTEAELSRIGYPPSAKRGNAVYYKERNLVLICRALANYFTVKANALEWEQS